jgi:formylglycine-generating enzyme required for sulfatase activity/tetratricopeptide (TPR) repeat protein
MMPRTALTSNSQRLFARVSGGLKRLPIAASTWVLGLLTFAIGFMPVFARPGYESALLLGLLAPALTALSVARAAPLVGTAELTLRAGLRRAAAHALAVTLALSLQALRAGWCDPAHDLTLLALGPIAGIFTAAAWGATVSLLWSRVPGGRVLRSAVLGLALLAPLLTALVSVARFYASPVVFAFDPFVGFFAGSPYDTGFDPTSRLLSYRAGTLGLCLWIWGISRHVVLGSDLRLRLTFSVEWGRVLPRKLRGEADPVVLLLATFGFCLFGAITTDGEALGHRSSTAFIRRSLGRSLTVGRCEIVYGFGQKLRQVQRLGNDCDAWLTRLERRLGQGGTGHVTVYVFDGAPQKELLMGAANTQIAKPWRKEIYLNAANYPDDVVGHELAHVVGGLTGAGPFHIAGSLNGWLPNPGLIEGLAVALAPDEDGDLTEREWSAALQRIGKLPRIPQLFSLDFLGHSGPLAYTVAGAFVEWVGQRHGKRAVRRWYSGESLEHATGLPVEQLEQSFVTELASVNLPDGALDAARARFARLGVYSRRCPHAVDRALAEADQRLGMGDAVGACRAFESARSLDRTELRARFGLGECAERNFEADQSSAALSTYATIASDTTLPLAVRQRAFEKQADLYLRQGHVDQARPIYARLLTETFDSERRRSLEVRLHAKAPVEIDALRELLLGRDTEPAWDVAVQQLLRWSESNPADGVADYLLGRNFWQRGRETVAVQHLDTALERGIEIPIVRAEAQRLRSIAACALGDKDRARWGAEQLAHEAALPSPRRLGLLRVVERCTGRRVNDDWPELAPTGGGASTPAPTAAVTASALNLEPANVATANVAPANVATANVVPANVAASNAVSSTPKSMGLQFDSDAFECPASMLPIRGGAFWVGSSANTRSADERPRFQTKLRGFCLDRTEVTVAAYAQCVDRGECRDALGHSASCNARHRDRANHPINCVEHGQAAAYCAQRNARLPTEVEWEYAARGGARSLKYPWGDASPDSRACWKQPSSCPVASYPPGAFGLFDMSGNVWEWTASDYGEYPWGTPLAGGATLKIYRGGGWSRRFEKWMHLGLRNRALPTDSGAHLGFRCAADAEVLGCPFETEPSGACQFGVVEVECAVGKRWNGQRCAAPGQPECEIGYHPSPGRGCVRDRAMLIKSAPVDVQAVTQQRSPEFDADCRRNQPTRPRAYRYAGASHEARNRASRSAGCKNRDVGVGWNSTCCP